MTDSQKEVRREQSIILAELCRITDKPSEKMYGLAGKLRKEYGFLTCMDVLPQIAAGNGIGIIRSAVRQKARACTVRDDLLVLCENWKD
ncbi:MAG: hypothetical protein PHX83_11920 [Acidobacteriia bacterium]|nr:hypothetical protein [Terriglobia bacterium]